MDWTANATEVWAKLPTIAEVSDRVNAFANTHNNEIGLVVITGVLLALLGILGLVLRRGNSPKKERRRGRTLSQRIKGIKLRIAADLITNAVEEGVHQGLFTKKNATWLYRNLGAAAGLEDLFPRRHEKVELRKQRIRLALGLGPNDPIPTRKGRKKFVPHVEDVTG